MIEINQIGTKNYFQYERWHVGIHAVFNYKMTGGNSWGCRINESDTTQWVKGLRGEDIVEIGRHQSISFIPHEDSIEVVMKFTGAGGIYSKFFAIISRSDANLIATDIEDMVKTRPTTEEIQKFFNRD